MFDSDTDINMEKKSEDAGKFRIAKHVRGCGFQKGHTAHTSKKDDAELIDAEGKSGQAKLMRPNKCLADDLTSTYLRKDE